MGLHAIMDIGLYDIAAIIGVHENGTDQLSFLCHFFDNIGYKYHKFMEIHNGDAISNCLIKLVNLFFCLI